MPSRDFEKARKLAPSEPEVYLQLAQSRYERVKVGLQDKAILEARILEEGVKKRSTQFTKPGHVSFVPATKEPLKSGARRKG